MKALVINLPKATGRMAFQTQQLDQLTIEFQRLPAVSIADVEEKTYHQHYATWERPLRYSEVACFLSHKLAWEAVVKENKPLLVLEDDALLSQNTPDFLKNIEKMNDIDYVTLEIRGRKKIVAKQATHIFKAGSLLALYQDRTGAAGYILWPSGAKKLIERAKKGKIALADAFISSTYNLNAYQVEPALIIQLDQCEDYGIPSPIETKSSIALEKKPDSMKRRSHWSFRFKRFIGQLKLGLRQLSTLNRSVRRYIKLSDSFNQ